MNPTRLRMIATACCTASALLLGTVGSAGADVPKVKVGGQVTLNFTPPGHFSGEVSSRKRACERKRRVALKYWMMPTGPADILDFDRTDAEGDWEIEIEPFATEGDYRAIAARRVVRKPNRTIICKRILSLRHHF